MKLRLCLSVLLSAMLLPATLVSCTLSTNEFVPLASFTKNHVTVSISLERDSEGEYFLSGTFLPPEGYHLYGKDIPLNGVDGLGRPTLLELTEESEIIATGRLTESVEANEPDFEPKELLVYPAGPVTLSLPIQLPPGNHWMDEELKITYMACSARQCKLPVREEIVPIRIPGENVFGHP